MRAAVSVLLRSEILAVLATLIIDAILFVVALIVVSSVVYAAGVPGTPHVSGTWTSILAISLGNSRNGGGSLADSRTFAITTADLDAITRSIPDTTVLSRVVSGTAPVETGGQASQIRVLGVDPSYSQLPEGSVAPGMFFTVQDATAANRVAVLGQTVASRLFPNVQSSIGQTIRIRNQPFTVLGVLASQSSVEAENTDDAILIPFQTSQIRMFGATPIDEVFLAVRDASQTGGATQQIEELLRQRHRVPSGQPDGFTIVTAPNPSTAGGAAARIIDRVLQFSRHEACDAKGLCGVTRVS
jgi:putative ABC transport system permease protein